MNSKIIYGTAWKKERTTDLVVAAVLQGFRAIDTACQPKHYREDLVGEALSVLAEKHDIKREDLFLQTKYTPIGGQDLKQPLPYDKDTSVSTQVKASVQTSLKNLRTTYLDSCLLHSPLATPKLTIEAWRALGALQDAGKIRTIGVSNTYNVEVLEILAAERRIGVVQNRWYQGNNWDRDVRKYCADDGIQYQSFWTLTGSPDLLQHPSLVALSQRAKCTPEQAVFKIAQNLQITPISGTTSQVHMQDDLAVDSLTLGDASDADVKAVLKLVDESN